MTNTEVLPSLFPWMRVTTKTIAVSVTERIMVNGAWSEGSRDLHECVNPETGMRLSMPELQDRFAVTAVDRSQSGGYAATSRGVAFVRRSSFRGRDYVTLELSAEDYQRLVTDKVSPCTMHDDCRAHVELGRECAKRGPSLDARTLQILGTIRTYKGGSYRKEALDKLGFTSSDAERLVTGGYISRNKANAIALTAVGRTIAASVNVR